MLPRNIDLTEHGDFSAGIENIFSLLEHETIAVFDEDGSAPEYMPAMQFMRNETVRDMFGKQEHKNQRIEIFSKRLVFYHSSVCSCCGKPLYPWTDDNGLGVCRYCGATLNMNRSNRLPWKSTLPVRITSNAMDIFNMR